MTFDEFKYLAENPLQYHRKAVFRLDTYCYTDEVYEDDNLSYTLSREYSSFYLTLDEAESTFAKIKSKILAKEMKIYCYFLYEIPIGIDFNMEKYLSIRVYDEWGLLTEHSVCAQNMNSAPNSLFRGRNQSMIKHKVGDFVEILNFYIDEPLVTISTALITEVPQSIEDCWAMVSKWPSRFSLDWCDDHYRYIDSPRLEMWDDRIHPIFVFKPRFPISNNKKRELLGYITDDSVLQDTYWRENGSEKDHIVTRVAAIDKRFRPDGPSLRPETFLPFYAAKEYIEASVSVNLTEDNPLDKLIDNLLHQYPDIFQRFTGFIINFINTDIKNWEIEKVDQYRWWKTLKEKYPNLSRINKVKHHTCQRIGGEQYALEIIAFK